MYAVAHPGRTVFNDFGIFGGSNGWWRAEIIGRARHGRRHAHRGHRRQRPRPGAPAAGSAPTRGSCATELRPDDALGAVAPADALGPGLVGGEPAPHLRPRCRDRLGSQRRAASRGGPAARVARGAPVGGHADGAADAGDAAVAVRRGVPPVPACSSSSPGSSSSASRSSRRPWRAGWRRPDCASGAGCSCASRSSRALLLRVQGLTTRAAITRDLLGAHTWDITPRTATPPPPREGPPYVAGADRVTPRASSGPTVTPGSNAALRVRGIEGLARGRGPASWWSSTYGPTWAPTTPVSARATTQPGGAAGSSATSTSWSTCSSSCPGCCCGCPSPAPPSTTPLGCRTRAASCSAGCCASSRSTGSSS